MKGVLDKVLSTARLNKVLQTYVDVCLRRKKATIGTVIVLEFSYLENIPPAFCIGFRLKSDWPPLNFPIGFIFVSKAIIHDLPKDELKFVVSHELAHIINNHSVVNALITLGKTVLIDYLAEKLKWKSKDVKNLIGIIKKIYFRWTKKITIEEKLKAQNELEADQFAVMYQRRKRPALSVLHKIANGIIDQPSHFTEDGDFKMPVITFRRRMTAIRNLRLPKIRILRKRIKRVVRRRRC